MTLVVEDATGLATAEGYITVDFLKAYFKDRNITISLGGSVLEGHIRIATEYIDIRWGSVVLGNPIADDQALVFPTDQFITDPVSLPLCLQRACAEYAYFGISNELFINNDHVTNGPGIKRILEKVGPIEEETEYSGSGLGSSTQSYPKVTKADALMRSITYGSSYGVIR